MAAKVSGSAIEINQRSRSCTVLERGPEQLQTSAIWKRTPREMSSFTQWLTSSEEFFRNLGWLGVFAFAGGIVLIQLFCGPTSPALITAGLVFGFGRGFAAAMLGTGIGAVVNFYLSRRLLRG